MRIISDIESESEIKNVDKENIVKAGFPLNGSFMCLIIVFRLSNHQCLDYYIKGPKLINWNKQNSKKFSLSIS